MNVYQKQMSTGPLAPPKLCCENSYISPSTNKLHGTQSYTQSSQSFIYQPTGYKPFWSPSCSPVKLGDWQLN